MIPRPFRAPALSPPLPSGCVPEPSAPARAASRRELAVSASGLHFAYNRRREVLRGVDFTAYAGQITMVLGASGGGKTTLLKLLAGLLPLQRGSLTRLGRELGRARRLDRRVAYIPQQLGLVRSLSVLDNTLTGALGRTGTVRSLLRWFPARTIGEAHDTLAMLGIGHKARERVFALSGGERQRVAIARALLQQPSVILADEFVSQLDPATSADIMEQVREITEGGVAVIMTTHELDLVHRYADRVVVLRDGRKVLDAGVDETDPATLAQVIRG